MRPLCAVRALLRLEMRQIRRHSMRSWLVVLLIHRAWRDEQRCRRKYGDLWSRYTTHARFRMIPFLY